MTTAGYKLFTPLKLAEGLTLKNRVVFAPLTRARSDPVTRSVVEMNELYYEQRTGAGLIITESTSVSDQAHGWYGTPAMYTEQHAAAWKKVVDRVHAKNSKIFMQFWYMGRSGHSSFSAKNDLVSASAIAVPGTGLTKNSKGEAVPYETPRALRTEEVLGVAEDFRRAAELAKAAGFDGIEIQCGNGFIIDQFLQSVSNKRTDRYGGSIENRVRLMLEVVDAVTSVWPADRVAVRVSPNGKNSGMGSPDTAETTIYAMQQLSMRGLCYLAILDGFGFGYHGKDRELTIFDAKKHFQGFVLANNSYTRDIAEGAIRSGAADFVSFGRPYISNPDLAERYEHDLPLNADPLREIFWDAKKGASGYIDFPFYSAEK